MSNNVHKFELFVLHEQLKLMNKKGEQILLPALTKLVELTAIDARVLDRLDRNKRADAIIELQRVLIY